MCVNRIRPRGRSFLLVRRLGILCFEPCRCIGSHLDEYEDGGEEQPPRRRRPRPDVDRDGYDTPSRSFERAPRGNTTNTRMSRTDDSLGSRRRNTRQRTDDEDGKVGSRRETSRARRKAGGQTADDDDDEDNSGAEGVSSRSRTRRRAATSTRRRS